MQADIPGWVSSNKHRVVSWEQKDDTHATLTLERSDSFLYGGCGMSSTKELGRNPPPSAQLQQKVQILERAAQAPALTVEDFERDSWDRRRGGGRPWTQLRPPCRW